MEDDSKLRNRSKDGYNTFADEPDDNKAIIEDAVNFYTAEDAVEHIGLGRFQLMVGLACGLDVMSDAMETMALTILGPTLLCEWQLSLWQMALVSTIAFVGSGVGAPVFGYIGDRFGRKNEMILAALWTGYFGVLSAFSPSINWMYILRFLCGLGIGGYPQAVTYTAEVLPLKHRARCIPPMLAFWALGALLEVGLALLLMETLGWRWWLGVSALPLFITAAALSFIPESPSHHVAMGRVTDASQTLEYMADVNKRPMPTGKLIAISTHEDPPLSKLLSPEFLKTTLLMCFIWFSVIFQYHGIAYFSTELLRRGQINCIEEDPYLFRAGDHCHLECERLTEEDYQDLLFVTLGEIPGFLLTMFATEFIGRRWTLAMESFGFAILTLMLFICMGRVPMLVVLFISRAFAISAYQTCFLYNAEVFPTAVRATAIGIGFASSRVGATIQPFVSQVLLEMSLYAAFSIYATIAILGGIAAMLLPIETKGKQLDT